MVHTGALNSVTIMYESGECQIGVGNFQTINGPGGVGGGITGTIVSGQEFHDIAQVSFLLHVLC